MERKPLSFLVPITVASGVGSASTPVNSAIANAGGYIRQIIVKAPYTTATFDFRIENANGHNALKRTEQVGEITDDVDTPLPAGIYSCKIEKASHDGSYDCEIIFAEVY